MRRQRGLIGFGSYEVTGPPTARALMSVGAFTLPGTCQACPDGQVGCGPDYCYATPTLPSGWPSTPSTPTTPQVPSGQCPAGQVGYPPACVAYPGGVPQVNPATAQAQAQCALQNGTWNAATGTCTLPQTQPQPAPAQPTTPAASATAAPTSSWWQGLTDAEKWVIVGLGALGGVALFALVRGASHRPSYAPNLRRGRVVRGAKVPIVRGKRWGHASAPKRYRVLGAKYASDYAFPSRYMYPVVFHKPDGTVNRVRSRRMVGVAKGYFTKHKHAYPVGVRRQIASNINKAAKRFGLRPDARA